jgi:alkylhydroperoxidase family enzyme
VAVWPEAPFFTAQERAALAFTEAATRLPGGDVTDEIWNEAAAHFDEAELAALVVAVATINAWNRMGVATRMTPESLSAEAPSA